MHTLLYISTVADGVDDAEVRRILEVAQVANPSHGITGLLLFNQRNFLQLLEGETGALKGLMTNISLDRRHCGLVRLLQRPIARRACEGWAMRPLGIDADLAARQDAVADALPKRLAGDIRELVVGFARLN